TPAQYWTASRVKKTRIAIGLQRVQVFSVAEKNLHSHQKLCIHLAVVPFQLRHLK
ncbi:hypothetical protein BDZ89DRAFT_1063892, partial [Hymenopellis radicata]